MPGGVLFIFIAALAAERLRIFSTAILIGAGVIAVHLAPIAARSFKRRVELSPRRRHRWGGRPGRGRCGRRGRRWSPASSARASPAHARRPLYETRGRWQRRHRRVVISPLVDIRSRLTNQQRHVELFRVFSEAPAYWRVTALPEFDGQWGVRTPAREPARPTRRRFPSMRCPTRPSVVQSDPGLVAGRSADPRCRRPRSRATGDNIGNERLRLRIDSSTAARCSHRATS